MSTPGRRLLLGVACTALLAAVAVPADAQTLYGSQAPPGAAYVRVFRTNVREHGAALTLGSTRFDSSGLEKVTPYRPVSPGIYQVKLAGSSAELIARVERYYTVAVAGSGIHVYEDPAHSDPARAQLVLYNLDDAGDVGLRTEDGTTTIIPPVSPGAAGRVTVNAVPVRLALFSKGELLRRIGDPGLERGSSYSAFVFRENGDTETFWTEAELALD